MSGCLGEYMQESDNGAGKKPKLRTLDGTLVRKIVAHPISTFPYETTVQAFLTFTRKNSTVRGEHR
jgi:hypothetical protein